MISFHAEDYHLAPAGVRFTTGDPEWQKIFDDCERLCAGNVRAFNGDRVLIEGSEYNGVWLETQPMGGEMYAKRDPTVALNNILIFMKYQRRDGKFPGMIADGGVWKGITAHYDWLQGLYFAAPALRMASRIGQNRAYLTALRDALSDFDAYLWRCRDSNGDGCLESWCIWDTGDDNCSTLFLNGAKMPENGAWGPDTPPQHPFLPVESLQFMGYSYACRDTLAQISVMLGDGKEAHWRAAAAEVREAVKKRLWNREKHAAYERDRTGRVIDCLSVNNLDAMHFGLFSQEMADDFLHYHLFNPDEFWTRCPLPSIAANDPYFYVDSERNHCADRMKIAYVAGEVPPGIDTNNWSGPCQGLTYQRSIDAFLRYGHHAETALVGEKFLKVLADQGVYVQQYHPDTAVAAEGVRDGYGPTMLAALEYISLLAGVNVRGEEIWWSADRADRAFTYSQTMDGHTHTLTVSGGQMRGETDGREIFTASAPLRILTDADGTVRGIFGLGEKPCIARVTAAGATATGEIVPNGEYRLEGGHLLPVKRIPFR